MSPTTAAQAIVAAGRARCRTCQNTGWATVGEDQAPTPCPTCKPYGARILATAIHAPQARVHNDLIDRSGTVLRAWRPTQGEKRPGLFVYCDIRYDDGLLAIAWERDLRALPTWEPAP